MGSAREHKAYSWLSLVAETAGVSGATVARVELSGFAGREGLARATVQVLDSYGAVVGATSWEGDARELGAGTMIDLGCDLGAALGSRIVGWIDQRHTGLDARDAIAPEYATVQYFDPSRAMKLILGRPFRRQITSSAAQVAA